MNALWPKTAIITAAMEMMGGKDIDKDCRTPEIMADAAYVMLSRDSRKYTGHFAVDDDVLAEEGGWPANHAPGKVGGREK